MVGESKLRQVLVPNATVLATLCFVMIMLGPLPIIYYIDSMQSGRHQKLFWIAEAAAIVNFAVCTILHLSGAEGLYRDTSDCTCDSGSYVSIDSWYSIL